MNPPKQTLLLKENIFRSDVLARGKRLVSIPTLFFILLDEG